MTPDGIAITQRVHAAVLVCVKTAAILGAILALGPLKEEDYMRLLKQSIEPKDRLVGLAGCDHSWPCFGFNHRTIECSRGAQEAMRLYEMGVCSSPF